MATVPSHHISTARLRRLARRLRRLLRVLAFAAAAAGAAAGGMPAAADEADRVVSEEGVPRVRRPWLGGLYSGARGFSASTDLPAAEYWTLGVFLEPWALPVLNPAFHVGVLAAMVPWEADGARWQLGGELSLFDLPASWVGRLFYNDVQWSPGLGAELLARPDFAAPSEVVLLLSPLRFRAGDALFVLCGIDILFRTGAGGGFTGWGVRLFRAAVFLW